MAQHTGLQREAESVGPSLAPADDPEILLAQGATADEIGIVARQGQQRLALSGGEDGTMWHGEDSGAADRPGNT